MYNMAPATPEEQESLEAACQKNKWVKRGGVTWQEDPYMEEYPYEFDRCFSMDDLSDFFRAGNWAIRQGVIYGDLAFIQQVNGGDEWWTLKQDGDTWVPFENLALQEIAEDRSELVRTIAGMRLATPEECQRLEYLPEAAGLTWSGSAFPYLDDGCVIARSEDFLMRVDANYMGKMLTFQGADLIDIPQEEQEDMTLLEAINAQLKAYEQRHIEDKTASLSQRSLDAIRASEAQGRAGRTSDARVEQR